MTHDAQRYDKKAASIESSTPRQREFQEMVARGQYREDWWALWKLVNRLIPDNIGPGSQVCEYGCFTAEPSVYLALAHPESNFTAFDISPLAVEKGRQFSQALSARVEFQCADMRDTLYPDNSIDLAFGSGVLHHVHRQSTFVELARILRPGGKGIFIEPSASNPLVNLYRKLRTEPYSPDEHPYTPGMLAELAEWAPSLRVSWRHEHFFSLYWLGLWMAWPWKSQLAWRCYRPVMVRLGELDDLILNRSRLLDRFSQLLTITFEKEH